MFWGFVLDVLGMYSGCFGNVFWMFWECFLDVLGMYSGCFLLGSGFPKHGHFVFVYLSFHVIAKVAQPPPPALDLACLCFVSLV